MGFSRTPPAWEPGAPRGAAATPRLRRHSRVAATTTFWTICRLEGKGFAGGTDIRRGHVVNEDRSTCVMPAGSCNFGDADVSRSARSPSRYLRWVNACGDLLECGTGVSCGLDDWTAATGRNWIGGFCATSKSTGYAGGLQRGNALLKLSWR